MIRVLSVSASCGALALSLACSSGGAGAVPQTTATPAAPSAAESAPAAAGTNTTTPASSEPTAGQLAAAGQGVFSQKCASCHGDQGQGLIGPALIGSSAALTPYATGRGLYDFISTNMPQNAPGSLSPDEYLQVVSLILVRNAFVDPQAPGSQDSLGGVQIRR